jgi:hypothetical protein
VRADPSSRTDGCRFDWNYPHAQNFLRMAHLDLPAAYLQMTITFSKVRPLRSGSNMVGVLFLIFMVLLKSL